MRGFWKAYRAHMGYLDGWTRSRSRASLELNAVYSACIDSDGSRNGRSCSTNPASTRSRRRTTTERPRGRLIYADSRGMLKDRVAALRKANIYERQRYRHIVGLPVVARQRRRRSRDRDAVPDRAHHARRPDGRVRHRLLPRQRARRRDGCASPSASWCATARGSIPCWRSRCEFERHQRTRHSLPPREGEESALQWHSTSPSPAPSIAFPASRTKPCSTRRSAPAWKSPTPAARVCAAPARASVVSGEVRAYAGDALGGADRAALHMTDMKLNAVVVLRRVGHREVAPIAVGHQDAEDWPALNLARTPVGKAQMRQHDVVGPA